MSTKLENLKVTKVDFVDEGANPEAHTLIKKNKDKNSVPDGDEKHQSIIHKLFSFIGKAAGMKESEIDTAVEEITKGDSLSFAERLAIVENSKIADEIWDICIALQSSLCSILYDEDLDSVGKATSMQKSLDEFQTAVNGYISKWSGGALVGIAKDNNEVNESDVEIMKSAVDRLNENIKKAIGTIPETVESKGEEREMRIDKSKLTETERAFYEAIEKKYGVEAAEPTQAGSGTDAPAMDGQVTKSVKPAEVNIDEDRTDDIYKGMHPTVRAELESLKKFREDVEDKEMYEIAKKYEIIGKKADELAPVLKSLKAAGGTAYTDMIAVLDQTVETVQKSGVFSEIGKSGHGDADNTPEAKIESIAKGMMEKDSTLSYNMAVAKAWEDNPDLMAEYDEQAGF